MVGAFFVGGSAYLHAYSEANGRGIMMNRAIGAIDKTAGVNSFGMMYQWGRKDPFTPATTTAGKDTQLYNIAGTPINTKSSNGIGGEWTHSSAKASNIATLTNTPSTYYTGGGGVPIASTGNLSNDWWNPATKTLYDPCPSGYRVPPYSTFNGFSTPYWSTHINNGITWNDSFFPASGLRVSTNGQFVRVGIEGDYWMSTTYNVIYTYHLYFHPNYTTHNVENYRSFGFPVRCICE